MEAVGVVKNVVIALGSLMVLAVAFLTYSGAVTFANWPWTKTEAHTSGVVMGFEIGASKSSCFQHAVALQGQGEIRALDLVDAEPGTYDERFNGTNLTREDFDRARLSNVWRLDLVGVNAWLLLTFEGDRLVRLERKDYRGPTE
ncbi:MAG TPA: hypothetical protein ENK43_14080 [Planctomycetes bacterium]|nr:hypothetical protein [Planctomycetota bacterium]